MCDKHFALFHTSRGPVECREMIASLEKRQPSRGKTLIIRSGKKRIRKMFDVNVVQFMEDFGRDQKYGIATVGGYGAVCDRVCDRHQRSLF